MASDFQVTIENEHFDPFWTSFSSIPFYRDFVGHGGEDNDELAVYRRGTVIGVEDGSCVICLDLPDVVTLWSALKDAANELRKVYQEQNRYLSERTAEGFAKKFASLPEDLRKASKEAAGIARILERVSADPVKEDFWIRNAAVLLDQLKESLHVITLTVSAAKAQAQVVSKKEKGDEVA